jgi:hypothetical protein
LLNKSLLAQGYSASQLQHHFGTVTVMSVINELHAVTNKCHSSSYSIISDLWVDGANTILDNCQIVHCGCQKMADFVPSVAGHVGVIKKFPKFTDQDIP